MWTAVGLYAFAAVFAAKLLHGDSSGINNFPANLLAAMGLSVVTATAAKAITSSQVSSGQVGKPSVGTVDLPKDPGAAALVQDDSGAPDLSKTQFLAWTIVGVVVYLYRLVGKVNPTQVGAAIDMPDIDQVLLESGKRRGRLGGQLSLDWRPSSDEGWVPALEVVGEVVETELAA